MPFTPADFDQQSPAYEPAAAGQPIDDPNQAVELRKIDQLLRHTLSSHREENDRGQISEFESWLAAALPERFQVKQILGRGTFGVVYLVDDLRLCREVAVKVLRPEWMIQPVAKQRFLRESRAAARLNHTHIVRVLEADENDQVAWQVCDAVRGAPLSSHLKQGPIAERQAARWIADLADGIGYAHDCGVVHRDIKPDNVLVNVHVGEDSSQAQVFLTDFGMAKVLDDDLDLSRSGVVLGTPRYMAPEQFDANGACYQPPADVYSLGVVLFECLTGQVPFGNASNVLQRLHQGIQSPPVASNFVSGLSKEIVTICQKAMAPLPEQRYATALELADELNNFLLGLPIVARPTPLIEQLFRLVKQHRVLVAFTLTLLVCLMAVASITSYYSFRISRQQSLLVHSNHELAAQRERAQDLAATSDRLKQEAQSQQQRYQYLAWNSGIKEAYRAWENGRVSEALQGLEQLTDSHPTATQKLEWQLLTAQIQSQFTLLCDLDHAIHEVHALPDTSKMMVASANGSAYLLDIQTRSMTTNFQADESLHALAIHPRLPMMALGGVTNAQSDLACPLVIDWRDGTVQQRLAGVPTTLESMRYSSDGEHLLCASRYHSPRIYRLSTGEHWELPGDRRNNWLSWLDATGQFVYQPSDRAIGLASPESGSAPITLDLSPILGGSRFYLATTISNSPWIAIAVSGNRGIWLLDSRSGEIAQTLPNDSGSHFTCMACNSEGSLLAAGSERGEVSIWLLPNADDDAVVNKGISGKLDAQPVLGRRWQVSDGEIRSVVFSGSQLICWTELGQVAAMALLPEELDQTAVGHLTNASEVGNWETAWAQESGDLVMRNEIGQFFLMDQSPSDASNIRKIGSRQEK